MSVVFLATNVSVLVGRVNVPVLTIVENDGLVKLGELSNTNLPVPVAPVEVTPSMVGWPVMVGALSNTNLPVPVAPVDVTPSTVTCPPTDNAPATVACPDMLTPSLIWMSVLSPEYKEFTLRSLLVLIVNVDPDTLVLVFVPPATVNVDPILKSCVPVSPCMVNALLLVILLEFI